MVIHKLFKINSKRIMLSVLLSVFPITAHAMLQSWKKLSSSVTQHLVARNLHKFDKFNTINIASLSSQSSFNSKNSKANKWAAAGIGTLGISTIVLMNQDSQKNTEFNVLIKELENNNLTNQAGENKTATPNKPKYFMFNANNNGLLAGATAQFKNFIKAAPIYMDELDSDPTIELFKSIESGTHEDVQRCLDKGANVHYKERNGFTHLHHAIFNHRIGTVRQLITAGADVNAKDKYGKTPLHYAVDSSGLFRVIKDEKIAELLINQGADINAKTNDGWTPLHYAAAFSYGRMIDLLIDKGADITAKTKKGSTPYDLAIDNSRITKAKIDLLKPNLFQRLKNKVNLGN